MSVEVLDRLAQPVLLICHIIASELTLSGDRLGALAELIDDLDAFIDELPVKLSDFPVRVGGKATEAIELVEDAPLCTFLELIPPNNGVRLSQSLDQEGASSCLITICDELSVGVRARLQHVENS